MTDPLRSTTMNRFELRTEPVRIDAPVEFVWDILADIEKYGD